MTGLTFIPLPSASLYDSMQAEPQVYSPEYYPKVQVEGGPVEIDATKVKENN